MKIFILLVSTIIGVYSYQGCKIHLSKLPLDNAPLYLSRSGLNGSLAFVIPNGGISLNSGEEIVLACPGQRNEFKQAPKTNIAVAKCQNGEDVQIFGKTQPLGKIECANKISSSVQTTGKACGKPTNKVKNIGFEVPTVGFVPLINICHDSEQKIPLFVVHHLHGTAQSGQQYLKDRPTFSSEGSELPQINRFYVQGVQPKNFESQLSSKQLAQNYIHTDSFLSRGHLVPNRDFPFNSWKIATFYFVNAAPQWYQTNSGNWNEIEQLVRSLGQQYRDDMIVITGTLATLTLPNANNVQTKIYLNPQQKNVPIPKYYWKIVVHPKSRSGISFVSVNNPYEKDIKALNSVCKNICSQAGVNLGSFNNATAGFSTCCDVREFSKQVGILPFEFESISGLLTNKW